LADVGLFYILYYVQVIAAMSEPNFSQQAGDFAVDAAIDTAADNLVNESD